MADATVDVTGNFDSTQRLLKITDNGDGTYAVNTSLSATDNAVLDDIAANQTDGTQITAISKVSGVVSALNSTVTAINAGIVFTGTWEIVTDYKSIGINVIASHASATNGLTFNFSSNGSDVDKVHSFTLSAASAKFFNLPVEAKYFRVVYTNGGTNQTYFRLQTIYHATTTQFSSLRLSENIDGETAAPLVRSVITGKSDGVYRNVVLDPTSAILPIIDGSHMHIHEGEMFAYGEVTEVLNAGTRNILIKTPDTTTWVHLFLTVQTELEGSLRIYEGPTTTGDGTAITVYNKNRNLAATTTTATVTHTPTIAGGSEGTLLMHKHWGSGKGAGGGDRSVEEWVLKQNTKYLIRVTNETASSNQCNIVIDYYEHANVT